MLGEYPVSMTRQWTGHTSTQQLHTTHLRRSMLQVFSSLTTQIAPDGHFLMHMPQEMQCAGSIATRPLEREVFLAGVAGYRRVTGLLKKVSIAVFAISKNVILYHLSAHPMQGSMESTITGTSARLHPPSIFTSGGRFVSVGVLIRDRTRCLVPFPLT